ncbi:hypothetical protein [Porphyrobacter sp. HT-58-2]|uniref:hypothetical protein n=1 Tax=Porphyrobacter sp. HT-58-2 TaxID=2023229 RepID=UPI0011AFFEB6|nr:hypothetical protein [Porphyrobacter sp. HT-58-2]
MAASAGYQMVDIVHGLDDEHAAIDVLMDLVAHALQVRFLSKGGAQLSLMTKTAIFLRADAKRWASSCLTKAAIIFPTVLEGKPSGAGRRGASV